MAQKKRESQSVQKANVRAAKLKSIDPALDVGNGHTLPAFTAKIAAVKQANDDYNTAKAGVDGQLDNLRGVGAGSRRYVSQHADRGAE